MPSNRAAAEYSPGPGQRRLERGHHQLIRSLNTPVNAVVDRGISWPALARHPLANRPWELIDMIVDREARADASRSEIHYHEQTARALRDDRGAWLARVLADDPAPTKITLAAGMPGSTADRSGGWLRARIPRTLSTRSGTWPAATAAATPLRAGGQICRIQVCAKAPVAGAVPHAAVLGRGGHDSVSWIWPTLRDRSGSVAGAKIRLRVGLVCGADRSRPCHTSDV